MPLYVDLGTVQKALGHSGREITAGTYEYGELEDGLDPVGLIRFRGQFDYAACFSR